MSTTTTKSGPKAKAQAGTIAAHRAAEAAAKAIHAGAMADETEADQLITQRAAAVEAAEAAVAAIEQSWATGDDGHAATDLVAAQAQVRRAEALRAAAVADKAAAQRRQCNTDTRLAEIVAEAVGAVSPFSPVATFLAPATGEAAEPAAFCVQSGAAEYVGGGELAGSVSIVNVRDSRWAPLDADAIERQLARQGQHVNVMRTGPACGAGDGLVAETYQVELKAAHEASPAILADPNDYIAGALAGLLASDAQSRAGSGRLALRTVARMAGVQRSAGERIARATVDVVFHPVGSSSPLSRSAYEWAAGGAQLARRPVAQCIADAAEAMEGMFVRGLGIVRSVERGAAPADLSVHPHESAVRFTVTCASRTMDS